MAKFQSGRANQVINHSGGKEPSKNRLMRTPRKSRATAPLPSPCFVEHRNTLGPRVSAREAINCGKTLRLSLNQNGVKHHPQSVFPLINFTRETSADYNLVSPFQEMTQLIFLTQASVEDKLYCKAELLVGEKKKERKEINRSHNFHDR